MGGREGRLGGRKGRSKGCLMPGETWGTADEEEKPLKYEKKWGSIRHSLRNPEGRGHLL